MPALATESPRRATSVKRVAKPFLKWVGGKAQLLDKIQPLFPKSYKKYFEPFIGGGALFFATRPAKASLSDVNSELIDCYTAIRDDVEGVIEALGKHRYDRDHFYKVREQSPAKLSVAARAARTIFLNKTGFNGLYRVNSKGQFNVPFGRFTNPNICDETNLRACHKALAKTDLAVRDFSAILRIAKPGDFVYFDPPYVPVSKTSDFTAYSRDKFGEAKQIELATVFATLAKKGVYVMLSNSDAPLVRELYRDFQIVPVDASRSINSKGEKRGPVGEVVVVGY